MQLFPYRKKGIVQFVNISNNDELQATGSTTHGPFPFAASLYYLSCMSSLLAGLYAVRDRARPKQTAIIPPSMMRAKIAPITPGLKLAALLT